MKIQNLITLIIFVAFNCLIYSELTAKAKIGSNHCCDFIAQTQSYIPIKASWDNIDSLMYDCVEKRLDIVNGLYKYTKGKAWDCDYQEFVAIAKLAKKYSGIDTCNFFSMENDTIFFIEKVYLRSQFTANIWDKYAEVVIYKNSEKNKLRRTNNTLKDNPELKVKIEAWDLQYLSAVKRPQKLRGEEDPSHVFRVIIQNSLIVGCEWILLESLYPSDSNFIIE